MRFLIYSLFAMMNFVSFTEVKAGHIVIRRDDGGLLKEFEVRNSTYEEVITILAALSGNVVKILSVPKGPLQVSYRDKSPEDAFAALLKSVVLDVTKDGKVYVVRARGQK